ncbi:sulfotransferase family protein [Pseudoalteromonas sp. DL2-H2.2]|uniref:sulfotransferase family 2 domain-containing protein n=1 Tax=Pseudoalteromonas sp. DL2-H2.2 TaxID=2908889 RepID=UPI001F2ED638|nr:sulfotransferase family 2 domain-containing protein [Pseudoalteromonas sp. DL2-H2.2]MCF2909719.1 sulfotransferase family protein [Pseudoalteromonas sp. DL2-H2.2]
MQPFINPFIHWTVDQIPTNATVAIYGTGELAKVFLKEVAKKNRNDIRIKYFLDSFEAGTFNGFEVKKYHISQSYDIDFIIIASMYWPNIIISNAEEIRFRTYKVDNSIFKLSIVDNTRKAIFRRNARTGSKDIEQLMLRQGATQQYVDITDSQYKDYFKFAFTRHPTTKFLSGYAWYVVETLKLNVGERDHINIRPVLEAMKINCDKPSLLEFLITYMTLDESERDFHFWGQTQQLGNDLNFIGKLENIHIDLAQVNSFTNLFNNTSLTHSSAKKLEDYKRSVSNECLQIIETIFYQDYLRFGYNP